MFMATHLIGFGAAQSGCNCTPAYATGDRSSSITVTTDVVGGTGSVSALVDGVTTDSSGYFLPLSYAVTGKYIRFDFGAGNSIKITNAKRYMQTTGGAGSDLWKWQGSDDATSWTDVQTGNMTWAGDGGTPVVDDLTGNATGYRYYQLVGVSGTSAAGSRASVDEVEFEQCTC